MHSIIPIQISLMQAREHNIFAPQMLRENPSLSLRVLSITCVLSLNNEILHIYTHLGL